MDMADLIAEVKRLKEKVQALEAKPGADPEKTEALLKALSDKIEALEKKAEKLSKPLEDSDFDSWDE
jgi:cell division FtsZ-interacting protein ZapD